MSAWELYTQLFARNWRCGRFARSLSKGCSEEISRGMVELINSDPAVFDALVTCDKSWIYCYDSKAKRQGCQRKQACSPRPKKAKQSKSTHKLLIMPFFLQHWHDLHAPGSHWTDSQQGILCWGFKEVQEEILPEEASTHQIGSVTFPLRGCHYETIEEMKEAVTKVIDTLTQEDFHGAFQKLLERYNKCIAAGVDYFEGDLSFICVLSIKVPIRKKSGNLLMAPRISNICDL